MGLGGLFKGNRVSISLQTFACSSRKGEEQAVGMDRGPRRSRSLSRSPPRSSSPSPCPSPDELIARFKAHLIQAEMEERLQALRNLLKKDCTGQESVPKPGDNKGSSSSRAAE